jgi:ABC-type phosphate/phosphonate transport system substrate-binding protein/DNA-binding CsgD family transcriptional regulator
MRTLLVLFSLLASASIAVAGNVSIGVLAYNGKPQAVNRWQPTADYLSLHIPGQRFQVVPLTHQEFEHSINKGELDFILTNPGHYVRLEVAFGATRIATFKARFHDQVLTQFSSVIFARKDSNIDGLEALDGKTLAAVSEGAFGGFQLAQNALLDHRIIALEDMNILWLGFPHSDVVKAVLAGDADVGTVRSGVLEKMVAQGSLDMSQLQILAQKKSKDFPLEHSVDLYPEWPFAKLPDTDDALAKKVAISLFQMSQEEEATLKAGGAGWTIPLDYTAVHLVLRRLQAEPYPPVALDVSDFWQAYQSWIIALGFLFLISLMSLLRLSRTNKQLKLTQKSLHRHQAQLEETVKQSTEELRELNQTLQEDVEFRSMSEQSVNAGCEALQALYSISTRHDLDRDQRLQSIVDLARHFLGAEYALLSHYKNHQFEARTVSPDNKNIPVPLNPSFAQEAVHDSQIHTHQNEVEGDKYIRCPVYIAGELHCLLEFTSTQQYQAENRQEQSGLASELGIRILKLISQWLGNEVIMADREKDAQDQHQKIRQRFVDISPREQDVLKLLVQSESTKSMARILNISTKTIELHRANLLRKTGAKSSIELVKLAVLSGVSN